MSEEDKKLLAKYRSRRVGSRGVIDSILLRIETGLKADNYDDLELDLACLEEEVCTLGTLDEQILEYTEEKDISNETLDRHKYHYNVKRVKLKAQKELSKTLKQESSASSASVGSRSANTRAKLPVVSRWN